MKKSNRLLLNKICLCCEKIFFNTKGYSEKKWNKTNYCCPTCGAIGLPHKEYIKQKIKMVFENSITTESGCIEWQGMIDNWGYGMIRIYGKMEKIHRFIYRILKGEIKKEIMVCHKCDNPICVNPEHLFTGTNQDNMTDMVLKGRSAKGFMKPNCKIADEIKIQLLQMSRDGVPHKKIASLFGIARARVSQISIENGIRRRIYGRK